MFHDGGPAWILNIGKKHLAILERILQSAYLCTLLESSLIGGELGRLDLIPVPAATQHILCLRRVALYTFTVSAFRNSISKQAKSRAATAFGDFSLRNDSVFNVPCLSFICSCHYPHFLPLPPSTTRNHPTWLPHSLSRHFSTWPSFLSTQDSWPLPTVTGCFP